MEKHFSNGNEIDPYMACGYAEDFETPDHPFDVIRAWSYLIGTKLIYSLQGWYGRTAHMLIDEGYFDTNGVVDWELVNTKL